MTQDTHSTAQASSGASFNPTAKRNISQKGLISEKFTMKTSGVAHRTERCSVYNIQ